MAVPMAATRGCKPASRKHREGRDSARDRAGTPRTGWFQLRTGLVAAAVTASVAHSNTLGHPQHISAAQHRPWRTAPPWARGLGPVGAEGLCCRLTAAQHKGPFSQSLRSVTAWRVKEAERNNAGRQRGQKISHHLCTNGFLPLC